MTVALTGEDEQSLREEAIYRLSYGVGDNRLDYIFTVDIFAEGVDIPEVNQVIMLRPTQSAIVFVQRSAEAFARHLTRNSWSFSTSSGTTSRTF